MRKIFTDQWTAEAGNAVSCSVGNNGYLDMCGRENGLQKYINLHRGFGKGVVPLRTMCATVEALVGAVFRGAGERLEAAKVAMRAWA